MSPLGTIILATCAIYGYVCVYYTLLAFRRRSEQEYLAFGLLSGALGLYSFSEMLYVGAETATEALRAHQVGSVALLVVCVFLMDFVAASLRRPNPLRTLVYGWAATGFVVIAAGLVWEAGEPPHGPYLSLLPTVRTVPVRATRLGLAYLAMGTLVPVGVVWLLIRARGDGGVESSEPGTTTRPVHRRVVFSTLGLSLMAGLHDVGIWAGLIRSFRILEYATLLFVFGMSYILLDRFVRTSQALVERTAQLRAAYDDLSAKQNRLVRKQQLAAVGELSAVIAHEVRNPLAVIKNAVSGLRRPTLPTRDRETLLSILDEETTRLNRLMHDLLAYARPVLPQARELDTRELLERAVGRAMGAAGDSADRIRVEYDLSGPDRVFGDPELLRHALVNVIENALQAMPEGGLLMVETRAVELESGGRGVGLSFLDDGEGMDTLVRDKARDPFFTTRPAGTGLGLAIVERVVRNHGGFVRIDSGHGTGTEVTLGLPCERTSMIPLPPPDGPRSQRLSGITEVGS